MHLINENYDYVFPIYRQLIVLLSFNRNSVLLRSCLRVFFAILNVTVAILQSMSVSIYVISVRLPIASVGVRLFWHEIVLTTDCKQNWRYCLP